VDDLFQRFFSGRGAPNLAAVDDINEITGCLKLLLRSLDDSLIPGILYADFLQSVGKDAMTSPRRARGCGCLLTPVCCHDPIACE